MRLFEKWRRDLWPTVVSAAFIVAIVVFVNWEASKTRVGEAMEGVGIDWTDKSQVTDGDKLNFVMATLMGVASVFVAILAYRISETQHEMSLAQQAQKPKPVIYWDMFGEEEPGGGTRHTVRIANQGEKSLREFEWSLWFPDWLDGGVSIEIDGGDRAQYDTALDDDYHDDGSPFLYAHYQGRSGNAVWPNQNSTLGEIVIAKGVAKHLELLWSVDCEDGTFPRGGPRVAKRVYGDDAIE